MPPRRMPRTSPQCSYSDTLSKSFLPNVEVDDIFTFKEDQNRSFLCGGNLLSSRIIEQQSPSTPRIKLQCHCRFLKSRVESIARGRQISGRSSSSSRLQDTRVQPFDTIVPKPRATSADCRELYRRCKYSLSRWVYGTSGEDVRCVSKGNQVQVDECEERLETSQPRISDMSQMISIELEKASTTIDEFHLAESTGNDSSHMQNKALPPLPFRIQTSSEKIMSSSDLRAFIEQETCPASVETSWWSPDSTPEATPTSTTFRLSFETTHDIQAFKSEDWTPSKLQLSSKMFEAGIPKLSDVERTSFREASGLDELGLEEPQLSYRPFRNTFGMI